MSDFEPLPGIDSKVTFGFNPGLCGVSCTCDRVGFVQVVRVLNTTSGKFDIAPDDDMFKRMTSTGWAVDRNASNTWGYYGMLNDGTFNYPPGTVFFPTIAGSNTTPAILSDKPVLPPSVTAPGRPSEPHGTWFDAVVVPVCLNGDARCVDRILGYYNWGFVVPKDFEKQSSPDYHKLPAQGIYDGGGTDYTKIVQEAIASWNAVANADGGGAALKKTPFPPLQTLQ